MEDCGGISLQDYVQEHPLTLVEILNIAIQLAEILHELHQARVIHKDIKPANILIHPQSKQIWLIDFSIASLLPKETQEIQNPNVLEGTLAYIAPEQTGRMNRGIDYRADFYSLGVTLYELLTGQLPFKSDDVMEMVHCHIAKIPTQLGNREEIPEVVSNIVLKLMAKNAEDRYQSALGLKHDLEQCLIQWKETANITTFKRGERDLSDRFLIPEKLYGREQEVQVLLDAFERVADRNSELMLVAGYSGVGKTAVINEVHKPITRQQGYFIQGKFDQFNRNIPFSAFVQAFRSLMSQLLSESDASLENWKRKILEALGENGQVIIDVIPELESLIGQQPSVPELSGTAVQNRFNLLFSKFVHVFTTKEHPLVIFLDDLQWADSASLNLLKLLMSESETGYLLVLGAYRDNEVFPAHPLMLTLDEITKQGANLNTLTLTPLNETDITRLVADTLLCSTEIAEPLSQLFYQKTKGNPFFTTQFLKGLHEDNCITFDPDARYWQCDLSKVKQLALTDDVVKFMVGRLQKLPEVTQNALKLAACIGNRFDLATLAVVCERSQDEIATDLWRALQERFVIPENETYKFFQGDQQEEKDTEAVSVDYRFLHDRVQQAAYCLIPDDQKQVTHLQMGQLLLQKFSTTEREERLFEIVNHLNIGRALILQPQEREELAQLNLMAGRKAKISTAYSTAITYLSTGIKLLPETAWESHYPLSLALHEEIAEASYLNTDFEQMEQWADVVLPQAKTLLDTIKVQQTRIMGAKAQGQLLDSINIGLQVLQELGIEFPEQPTQGNIGEAYEVSRSLWIEKPPQSLIDLPTMSDPHLLAAMDMLTVLVPAAYMASPNLMLLLVFKQVELSIQLGNSPVSILAYVDYGLILCGIMGDITNGYEFGELALSLLEKFQAKSFKGRAGYVVHAYIKHWKTHLSHMLPRLQSAYRTCLEIGDMEMLGWNAVGYCSYAYHTGQNLAEVAQIMEAYRQIIVQYKLAFCLPFQEIYQQTALNLLGQAEIPDRLTGEVFNQEKSLPQLQATNQRTALFFWFFNQSILYYIFGKNNEALQTSTETAKYLDGGTSMFMVPLYFWFDALIQLAQCAKITQAEERESILLKVQQHQAQLHHWATLSPVNHQHRWELVEAERCRVLGKHYQAGDFYDRAIASAKENGFIQDEALANELAAKFYLNWGFDSAQPNGKEKVAAGYMQEAYYCYSRWGAKAKVIQLEQQYPELLAPILQQQVTRLDTFQTLTQTSTQTYQATSNTSTHLLDFTSVMKASQALSGEIELEKLITKLMQVILENAGATKGVLIFNRDEQLSLEAVATQSSETRDYLRILQNKLPVEDSSDVPLKLVNRVKRQLHPLMFDNVLAQSEWASDEYLLQHQPKSLLCFPLLNQGKLLAILYLENTLMTQAFTPELVEILKLLCSQAAISLENAELYRQAQDYAQQLKQSLTQLQEAQVQLVQSEKMSALGQMMSGITHEINNPLCFVSGNINQVEEALQEVLEHLEIYQQNHPPGEAVTAHAEEIELEYLLEDLPEMVSSMKTGVNRIKEISQSMRIFSRADQEKTVEFDLHEGLESTLLILRHRLKANEKRPEIRVIKNYGDLPKINGFPGQLNQVFMNILANAVDVFDEMSQKQSIAEIKQNLYQITLKTGLNPVRKTVKIHIQDNGCGMPEKVKSKVFEHLFTTKVVGKGTGLGLSIARQIVVDKHGGKLECNSTVGVGTEFIIQIPVSNISADKQFVL